MGLDIGDWRCRFVITSLVAALLKSVSPGLPRSTGNRLLALPTGNSKLFQNFSFVIACLPEAVSMENRQFKLEAERRPEGPLANSHAREGVEQAIKLIPRSEGPADD